MALYLIGDLQGCDEALGRLLIEIDFSASRDTLVLLGDLVNRGPDSLAVLRRLIALEGAAHCLLGNHDLHLLAVAHGVRKPHRSDTLDGILRAPDRAFLLDWLRTRSMALHMQGWLLVHAGVLPQWDLAQTLSLAGEVEGALRSSDWGVFARKKGGWNSTPKTVQRPHQKGSCPGLKCLGGARWAHRSHLDTGLRSRGLLKGTASCHWTPAACGADASPLPASAPGATPN
jgi:hypothetical protein